MIKRKYIKPEIRSMEIQNFVMTAGCQMTTVEDCGRRAILQNSR